MSYRVGTPNYNLPQTEGTDKRDWFDTNESFANVDADLHSAVQTSTTHTQKIEQIEGTIGQLNTRVGNVEEDVTHIKADVTTAQEDIGTLGTTLSGLTTEVRNNKGDLEDMITAYEETSATASASHNVGDYFRYNDVLYITTITIRVGDTIVPDVNCRSTNVMTRVRALENQGGGQSPLASSVLYDNSTSGLQATDVQGAIDEIDGTLDIVSQGVQTNGTHIGDLTTLETTAKSNLVSAINEVLRMTGGGGMPLLDFANPLHTFASGQMNYTVTKDSYICGTLRYGSTLIINGKNIAIGSTDSISDNEVYISPLKVTTGDIITGSISNTGANYLHVLDVR